MIIWKDVTTYKQGDAERKPNVIDCKLSKSINLRVHKHIYFGEEWLLSCVFIGIERLQLNTTDIEEAKKLALIKSKEKLMDMNFEILESLVLINNELLD